MNDKPLQVYLFCCLSKFDPSELGELAEEFRIVPLPCSGKADILYLTKAFETGADGVAVLMCPEGECRYVEGNLRAKKRVEAVDALLAEAGRGQGRVVAIQLDEGGTARAIGALRAFHEHMSSLAGKGALAVAVAAR